MNHWIRPSCDSRTGASHRRRGAPCQDASGFVGFRDADGTPIQVLVVSDGHGGARYARSDVGARLACEVAMRELRQALSPARVAGPGAREEWQAWLFEELPGRIVAAWRREVEDHWRADPGADGSGFTPVVYGATLGVLLLTPAWWAHTGLGDWDLVRIEAADGETLLSEEPEREAGGEATFSLCLERAERHFAPRTVLEPLTPETPPFALLLCSDGLRKSCASDEDFLMLSRYLEELRPSVDPAGSTARAESTELAEALDHISRQGSGDDISIAVARWAAADPDAAWPAPGRSLPQRVVQPASADPIGFPEPAATAETRSEAMAETPALGAAPEHACEAGDARDLSDAASAVVPRSPSREARPASIGSSPVARRRAAFSPRPGPRRRLMLGLVLLGLGGAALLMVAVVGIGSLAGRREPSPLTLTPGQRSDLLRQAALLCGSAEVPGGGLASGGQGPEPMIAASSPGDVTRRVTMDPSQGAAPPPAGSATASGALLPQAEVNAPASATPARRSDGTTLGASGTTLLPGSGAAGVPRGPSSSAAPPAGGGAGSFPSGATAGSRSLDPQRLHRITTSLVKRDAVFQRLESGDPAQVAAALLRSEADPLTALIAYSATDRTLRPVAAPAERPEWLSSFGRQAAGLLALAPRPGGSAPEPASPLAAQSSCPELRQALRAAWQRHPASGAAVRPAPSPGASAPVRAVAPAGSATEVVTPAGPARPSVERLPASPDRGTSSRRGASADAAPTVGPAR